MAPGGAGVMNISSGSSMCPASSADTLQYAWSSSGRGRLMEVVLKTEVRN
jgi:hypothetical protein